jgi:hypothetical protein
MKTAVDLVKCTAQAIYGNAVWQLPDKHNAKRRA